MQATGQLIEPTSRAICSPIHHRKIEEAALHTADDAERSGEGGSGAPLDHGLELLNRLGDSLQKGSREARWASLPCERRLHGRGVRLRLEGDRHFLGRPLRHQHPEWINVSGHC
jgi:hypothetical protein